MLRTLVLGRMGRYGDEAVIAEAKKRFQAHVDKSAILPADLRSPVSKTLTCGLLIFTEIVSVRV